MTKPDRTTTSITVSLDTSLLKAVDKCAKQLCYTRDQFLSMACQHLIEKIDVQELERIYCERRKQDPEELDLAEAGAILAGEILPKEEFVADEGLTAT